MPRPSEHFDAAVIGGGPAGATCALHLARAGLRVALLEKEKPPRYKTCGGGVVLRARKLLKLKDGDAVEQVSFAAEMHLLDAGLRFRVERPEPLVTMTLRADLDHLLLRRAAEAGAEVMAPCALSGLGRRDGIVEFETDRGTFGARYVVAADGAASRTAGAAGWAPNRHNVPALECELAVSPRLYDRFAGAARFDSGTPVHGYAWVFPKRAGHLSVGCLSTRRGARGIRRDLEGYIDRLGLAGWRRREDHGFVIPAAPRAARLARDRVLLTGDAAGLADPVTFEGISHAVLSGRLAARAIVEATDDPTAVSDLYQGGLAREILPELRIARFLARLLYDYPRLRLMVFRRLGQPLCEAVADIIAGRLSYAGLLRRACRPRTIGRFLLPPRSHAPRPKKGGQA